MGALGEFPVSWGDWLSTGLARELHYQEMALANPAIEAIAYNVMVHEVVGAAVPSGLQFWFELMEPASGARFQTAGALDATANETHDPRTRVLTRLDASSIYLPAGDFATGMTVKNTKWTFVVGGSPTGGSWTIAVGAPGVSYPGAVPTTSGIAPGATAASIQAKLEALSSVGVGNVLVTGADGGPYTVEFVGALRQQAVTNITVAASLTGGSSPTVTPTLAQAGAQQIYTAAIANVPHRLMAQNGQVGDAATQVHVSVVGHELSHIPILSS